MAIMSGTPKPDPYQAGLEAFAGASAAAGGQVYMGQVSGMYGKNDKYLSPAAQASLGKRKQDLWVSQAEAEAEFRNWNTKKQSDFMAQGILSGMLKLGDGPLEGAKLWEKLVKEAAKYGALKKKVSPFDLMASYVQASGGANAWTSAGVWQINTQTGERKYTGPGTYLGGGKAQQTDTRIDLTDPDTARALSTQLFQNLMGRDPGAGELGAFANALHQAEQNSPVVSTTTTEYDMETGQQLGSDTTQTGGLTADGKAYIGEQQIKKKKEYGVTQAVTTYQNAFESLIYGAAE